MPTDFRPLEIPRGAYNLADARRGEPGPPTRVVWDEVELAVTNVVLRPRTTGRDRGGSAATEEMTETSDVDLVLLLRDAQRTLARTPDWTAGPRTSSGIAGAISTKNRLSAVCR